MNKGNKEIETEILNLNFKLSLALSGIRNLLAQNNPNGVNDYLINSIERAL